MFYIILKDYYELHIFRNEQVSELASMTPSKIGDVCTNTIMVSTEVCLVHAWEGTHISRSH